MIEIRGPAQLDPLDEQPVLFSTEIHLGRSFYSIMHDGVRLELQLAQVSLFYASDFDAERLKVTIPAFNSEGNRHTSLVYDSLGEPPLAPDVQLFELPRWLWQPVERARAAFHAMRADAVHGRVPPPRVPLSLENPEAYAVLATAVDEYGTSLSDQADALPRDSHAAHVLEESAARVDAFAFRLRKGAEVRS